MPYQDVVLPVAERVIPTVQTATLQSQRDARPTQVTTEDRLGPRSECHILTTVTAIAEIADEWRSLHAKYGRDPFSDYDMILVWWLTIGGSGGNRRLHIVTVRRESRLVAILPLVVSHSFGLRIMRGVGVNSERFCDVVAADSAAAGDAWNAAYQSCLYDFAICRGLFPPTPGLASLSQFARERDLLDEYCLHVNGRTAKAWLASLRTKVRSNLNRRTRLMREKGSITYEVYTHKSFPLPLADAMILEKQAWCLANRKASWVLDPAAADYMREVSRTAAKKGQLFLACLKCDDQLVAYQQGYLYGGVLYEEFRAHNPEWAQQSPGHVVLAYMISWAIDNGYTCVNFGPGDRAKRDAGENACKATYADEVRPGMEFTFSRTARGKALETSFFLVRSVWRKSERFRSRLENPNTASAAA